MSKEIVHLTCEVADDVGHGGVVTRYEILSHGSVYEAWREEERRFPQPGDHDFQPSHERQKLPKNSAAIQAFLKDLVQDSDILKLGDVSSKQPFLHPTSYRFEVETAQGDRHVFTYKIEGSQHEDPRYKATVEATEAFFQATEQVRVREIKHFVHGSPPEFSFDYPLFEHWETRIDAGKDLRIFYSPDSVVGIKYEIPPSIDIHILNYGTYGPGPE